MSPLPHLAPPAPSPAPTLGALAGLAILKVVMLVGLFTRTPPYPPLEFAPLFGASLALAALAAALLLARSPWFLLPTAFVLLESLLSFGPQKLYPGDGSFFAQSPAVYPAILVGSALILLLARHGWTLSRAYAATAEAAA